VRATFEVRFTARRMAEDYVSVYRSLAHETAMRPKLRVIA